MVVVVCEALGFALLVELLGAGLWDVLVPVLCEVLVPLCGLLVDVSLVCATTHAEASSSSRVTNHVFLMKGILLRIVLRPLERLNCKEVARLHS